jgi:hypothetical protein
LIERGRLGTIRRIGLDFGRVRFAALG